ncbi:MAG: polymerase subunit sigma-70 [Rhodospirillales bacterium]|jgi:RNA polymerase sigma-70 factor (ECF subfamily)|nr:polymerase subunit sigma-70 [Rhodospirillales bacterium]
MGDTAARPPGFEGVLADLRPKLHRYCARMTGSVVDGEDVLQDAMIKVLEAYPAAAPLDNPEGWVFRITHNTALDFLRRRARQTNAFSDEDLDSMADPITPIEDRQVTQASLRTFMRLPVAQRSSVILMDVLGYSLNEIGAVTGSSLPSIKASLHRGRDRLRELASEPDDRPIPMLSPAERSLLESYVERFNARDFDALRDMLADESRLDLVNRSTRVGKSAVSEYFGNYSKVFAYRFVLGYVDGQPAILALEHDKPSEKPAFFVLLEWADGQIVNIRDFIFAKYAIESADLVVPD